MVAPMHCLTKHASTFRPRSGSLKHPGTVAITTRNGTTAERDLAWPAAGKLWEEANRVGMWMRCMRANWPGYLRAETDYWCATTIRKRLYFHPSDVPFQV
jgi:hypothetical protein